MKSPITGGDGVEIIESINVSDIVKLYKNDYNLNVSRYFQDLSKIEICKCKNSGFRFYYPFFISGDELFYEEFQRELGNYYKPNRWEYFKALNYIRKDDKVLEIGTGSGTFFELLSNKVENPVGLELSNKAIEIAKSKGLNIINELIEDHALKYPEYYDVICFFQVLEHISDIKSFLESAIICLKPGGKLILAVPNNNPYIYRFNKMYTSNLPPHHSGLWDKKTLENLVDFFDLENSNVLVEPLFGIKNQLLEWSKFKKYGILNKLIDKIPSIFYKVAGKFAFLFDGLNLLAVYHKKNK